MSSQNIVNMHICNDPKIEQEEIDTHTCLNFVTLLYDDK